MADKLVALEAVRTRILKDVSLPLRDNGKLVFGKGNPNAQIVLIAEAPGEKEAEQGIPFVGRAGKELDKLLQRIGLTLDDVYICNILKYRPPKNRDPSVEEIENHTPYLIEQLKIIQPKIVATLGNYSTKFVLGGFTTKGMKTVKGISVLHGKEQVVILDGVVFTIIPIYHPAAMLYNPRLRDAFEEDFIVMGKMLGLEDKSKVKRPWNIFNKIKKYFLLFK